MTGKLPAKVAVRADAGRHIGAGHVMRCLTLAHVLKAKGSDVAFLCRAHANHMMDAVTAARFAVHDLGPGVTGAAPASHGRWLGVGWQTDAEASAAAMAEIGGVDLLVVDHYALDERWQRSQRPYARRILVIDDLADRPHDADMLLDQNLGRRAADYDDLVRPGCRRLIGPDYALLRPEFAARRAAARVRRDGFQSVRHVLVSLGGVDAQNLTARVLSALAEVGRGLDRVTVALGASAPHVEAVREQAARLDLPVRLVVGASDMADLMIDADLAIGAAGMTNWERCCLGLPTIAVVQAENQRQPAHHLMQNGALIAVLDPEDLCAEALGRGLAITRDRYIHTSQAAAAVCDGQGAGRIWAEIVT